MAGAAANAGNAAALSSRAAIRVEPRPLIHWKP
jgi:hypothetical protein